jgi:hypothetical protein
MIESDGCHFCVGFFVSYFVGRILKSNFGIAKLTQNVTPGTRILYLSTGVENLEAWRRDQQNIYRQSLHIIIERLYLLL